MRALPKRGREAPSAGPRPRPCFSPALSPGSCEEAQDTGPRKRTTGESSSAARSKSWRSATERGRMERESSKNAKEETVTQLLQGSSGGKREPCSTTWCLSSTWQPTELKTGLREIACNKQCSHQKSGTRCIEHRKLRCLRQWCKHRLTRQLPATTQLVLLLPAFCSAALKSQCLRSSDPREPTK